MVACGHARFFSWNLDRGCFWEHDAIKLATIEELIESRLWIFLLAALEESRSRVLGTRRCQVGSDGGISVVDASGGDGGISIVDASGNMTLLGGSDGGI